jgi:hypothetical protein
MLRQRSATLDRFWSPKLNTVTAVVMVSALTGCSAGISGLGPSKLSYEASNAIVSAGYNETMLAPDHYRVEITGYPSTPRARMEKMAATRAAQIGKENRLGYFRINGYEQTTRCKKFAAGAARGAGGEERKLEYVVLTADVSYAKSPPDTSYVQAKTAFDQYKAELDADATPPLPVDPAASVCK